MALAKPEMPSADVLPAGQSEREASPQYVRRGLARWMGASWKNHKTTSGEMFDPGRLTAAHDSLPLPSFLYVTNRSNGRTVLVRVNDRVPANANRVVIVSQLAAELLGFGGSGQADVDLQFGGPAAVEPNAKHEEAFLKSQPWFHRDLLRDTLSAKAGEGDRPAGAAGRYPAPQYPRWDNTQR